MLETLLKLKESLLAQGISGAPIDAIDEAIEAARQAANQSSADVEAAANRARENANKAAKDAAAANSQVVSSFRASSQSIKDYADAIEASGEGTAEQVRQAREAAAEMDAMADAASSATAKLDGFGKSMGLGRKMTDSFTGSLLQAGNLGFAALGEKMKQLVSPQALFASGLAKMESATKDLMFKFDEQQASLSVATATTGEYNGMMYDMMESNKSFGVGTKEAGEAIAGLHTEMMAFSNMNQALQTQLATTAARMSKLGVSGQQAGAQFDALIMGMGMTAQQADKASLELIDLGTQLGIAADKMSKDFVSASKELAKYGPEATEVFKDLAAAAKATGVEMDSLMSITKQFDTFEGAAEAAGKLNAVLGGGVINSMDLLHSQEEDRIRLIIQATQANGQHWESLNRHERQMIANAAGIKDMSEAHKLFSMSLSAYDEMQSKAGEASAEQANLQARAQAAQDAMAKFAQIGQAFAVAFMPVLDFLHGFANVILEINDMTGGIFVPAMVLLTGVLYFATGGFKSFALGMAPIPKQAPPTAASIMQIAASMTSLSAAMLPLIPMLTSFGLAIAAVGLALAAPFIAIAAVVYSFSQLFMAMMEAPKAIAAAVVGMLGFALGASAALIIMAAAIALASMILAPFAVTMLLVAPALMAFGVAALVAVLPFLLLGKALEMMAAGLLAFKEVGFDSLVMAAVSLAVFSAMLSVIAGPLAVSTMMVGIGLMLFGKGLQAFATGIIQFNDVGVGAMLTAVAALGVMAFALWFIAGPLGVSAMLVGIGLMLLGGGLQSFAEGLVMFNKIGYEAIFKMLGTLGFLAYMLIWTATQLFYGGIAAGIGLNVIGTGLLSFAKGLKKFNRIGYDTIAKAMLSLIFLAKTLSLVAGPLFVAGILVGYPLQLIGDGLYKFGRGLKKFNKIGAGAIAMAVTSLFTMSIALTTLAPQLLIAGLLVGVPLQMIGDGLIGFAKGIKSFNRVSAGAIAAAIASLTGMAIALILAAPMFFGMLTVGTALLAFGSGLYEFGRGIKKFNKVSAGAIGTALTALVGFAITMWFISPLLLGLAVTMLLLGPAFMVFGKGLGHLAKGLRKISRSGDGLMSLANAMGYLAFIGMTGAFGLMAIGAAIMGIAFALMFIPEKKAFALGFTLDGYARAMQAVSALTPESVEAANQVVEAAGRYVEIQAEMRMPSADAFVQAMASVFGGDSDSGGGQDIVLKVNNREFARAVDVAINRSHNLRMD